jgi:hypothetical protein
VSVARGGDEGRARRSGEAHAAILGQQDRAARHTDRRGELLGHGGKELVQVERGGEVGGHVTEHAGRRTEARQRLLDAGDARHSTVTASQHQREGTDRRQHDDSRVELSVPIESQQAEKQQKPADGRQRGLLPSEQERRDQHRQRVEEGGGGVVDEQRGDHDGRHERGQGNGRLWVLGSVYARGRLPPVAATCLRSQALSSVAALSLSRCVVCSDYAASTLPRARGTPVRALSLSARGPRAKG